MADNLTKLKQSRQGYRLNARKLVDKANEYYTNRDTVQVPQADLAVLGDKLTQYNTTLEKLNSDIFAEVDVADFEAESAGCLEIQEAIWEAQSKLSTLIAPPQAGVGGIPQVGSHPGSVSECTGSQAQGHRLKQVKLPKLALDKFSGDPLDWQEFWDGFESTIDSSDLSTIDKFKYLKKSLEGDAAKMVNGYRVTDSNYAAVVDALKERFGNREVAVNAHFEQLLGLSTSGNDTGSLQTTYDQCERHIRSLVALGLSEDTFGVVFAPIILSKLPKFVRVELHRQNGSKQWDLNKLRELFKSELKARQMGEWSLGNNGPRTDRDSTGKGGLGGSGGANRKGPTPTTGTFMNQNKQAIKGGGTPRKVNCIFCCMDHYSDECTKVTEYAARKAIAIRGKHCFKCLSNRHQIKECPRSTKCFHCGDISHHSSLCAKRGKFPVNQGRSTESFASSSFPIGQLGGNRPYFQSQGMDLGVQGQPPVGFSPALNPSASSFAPRHVSSHAAAADGSSIHLQMALVKFSDSNSEFDVRVFLDPGSSCSYIRSPVAKRLRLKAHGSTMVSNARFGDVRRNVKSYETVTVPIPVRDGSQVDIDAFVTDVISPPLQKLPLSLHEHPILRQVQLSDMVSDTTDFVSIDILIGQDYYFDFVGSEQIRLDKGLLLLGSRLGYIVAGRVSPASISASGHGSTMIFASMLNFSTKGPRVQNPAIEQFWKLDAMGITDDPFQNDDDMAVQHFNKHIEKVDGRYFAAFPWKEDKPDLPNNFDMALARLRNQSKRLKGTPEFLDEYDKILQNQVRLGVIEEVTPNTPIEKNALIHYLPHHAVIKPSSVTTKVRVVHDASAKATKDALSLNDCLFRGPVFLSDICGLLLRFRTQTVAFVCDIEKAFFQVGLRLQDRDVTRFLWLREPTQGVTPENLLVYRFARVPFGIISSPFLLGATVKHHLLQNDSEVAHDVAENIYVDNIISGTDSTESAQSYYIETQRLFKQISMNVREWFTNDKDFLKAIPDEHKGADEVTKVLGMIWDTSADTFSFANPNFDKMPVRTKRHLIQAVSTVYDPCGYLSPILTKAKLLVQDTWRKHVKWDEPISEEMISSWEGIKREMAGIGDVKFPRFLGKENEWEIHCFCDASAKAYAAAVYLRSFSGKSHLIFSKCRLAPIKSLSLPRLELMGVLAGTQIVHFVKEQLPLKFSRVIIWSDSKCVLRWIATTKLLSVFVTNRVREIKTLDCEFRYVPTAENPADIPTRGLSTEELRENSMWWSGPKFLEAPESEWPTTNLPGSVASGPDDVIQAETMVTVSDKEAIGGPLGMDPMRFSSLGRLLRVTCYVYRFAYKLLSRLKRTSTDSIANLDTLHLWVHEIQNARVQWIRNVQCGFEDSTGFSNLKRQLGLFKDTAGIWRCRGRIQNSAHSDRAKSPVLLPSTHRFTELVIADCHEMVHHAGVSHTLAELRSAYWVPCGRSTVSRVIKGCQICRIWEGGPYKLPPFPPLPEFRVNRCEPFAYTGVDYLGPLMVSKNGEPSKVWVCLFTCAATRAIHLEVVGDLTTDQFLLCLRRFVAVYGRPRLMISDNGKQFRLANDVLKKLWYEICKSPDIHHFLADQEIKWKFIPEYAPWMGGFYERLVGSVKRSLKKTLGRRSVSFDVLQTLVAEIGSVLNCRPLVLSDDVNDQVLTPTNLLGRQRQIGLQSSVSNEGKDDYVENPGLAVDLVRRWKDNEWVLNKFWEIWHRQYLTALRERQTASANRRGSSRDIVAIGVPVLIYEDKLPRSMWKLGRVAELVMSADGVVRSAIVQLVTGRRLTRPIKFLYPLQTNHDQYKQEIPNVQGPKTGVDIDHAVSPGSILKRPKRKAAQKALKAVRFQLQDDSDDSDT